MNFSDLKSKIALILQNKYSIPRISAKILATDIISSLIEQGRDPYDQFYIKNEIIERFGPYQLS